MTKSPLTHVRITVHPGPLTEPKDAVGLNGPPVGGPPVAGPPA